MLVSEKFFLYLQNWAGAGFLYLKIALMSLIRTQNSCALILIHSPWEKFCCWGHRNRVYLVVGDTQMEKNLVVGDTQMEKISTLKNYSSHFLEVCQVKNPVYRRHQLSWLMRIVGPIQRRDCVIYLFFTFFKHWPSGPMLSISQNVRRSVCVCVCVSVWKLSKTTTTTTIGLLKVMGTGVVYSHKGRRGISNCT